MGGNLFLSLAFSNNNSKGLNEFYKSIKTVMVIHDLMNIAKWKDLILLEQVYPYTPV
ncbi:MAG: hypothetical protein Ct9H300mP29_6460 [Candidatus Neomarinimicrobiota bacterium]|nr:MAG: hypothetical protein Ct9H300mP29_6460 [Candidatus Neomarinimicrobiota bacterium]